MVKRNNALIVLGVAAIAFIAFLMLRDRKPFGGSNTSFASEPVNRITRIEFTEGDNMLTLSEDGEQYSFHKKDTDRNADQIAGFPRSV